MKQYLFTVILTAAVTLACSWAVWQLSLRFKLYPGIRERDVHTTPTPRLGGVAMLLGILAAFAASAASPFFHIIWAKPLTMWSVLGAVLLIAIVGVIDDLWDLDWMIKLGAQFLAAGLVTIVGGLQIASLPLAEPVIGSSWLSIVITMFAIVIVMNAVNFIDGLDGLVAGVCLIANGVFFAY
ncbi:MAG: undecaprenyl-phosphate alpha-N-acetylglucosaminyl 1-phosphate transferase, partial [Microbacterium sp. 14-71-5]